MHAGALRLMRSIDEEGRELLESLNIDVNGQPEEEARPGTTRFASYRHLDAVWRHPTTGAAVFVGNEQAARSKEVLAHHGVSAIVNCKGPEAPLYHEADPAFSYFRFNISFWMTGGKRMDTREGLERYTARLFAFIDEATGAGRSVLVHCLAGAHRAGTTGVLVIMHKAGCRFEAALAVAKQLRPAINPIGHLRTLGKAQHAPPAAPAGPLTGPQPSGTMRWSSPHKRRRRRVQRSPPITGTWRGMRPAPAPHCAARQPRLRAEPRRRRGFPALPTGGRRG